MPFMPPVETIALPPVLMSCRAAMTGNSNLTTPTADGISLNPGDRVLCPTQTVMLDKGIYVVVASGTWGRSYDMQHEATLPNGLLVYVREGVTFENQIFSIRAESVAGSTIVVGFSLLTIGVM